MVFKNEKNGNTFWALSDSSKDQEGKYTNQSYQVAFPRKVGTPNDRDIIKWEGFTSHKKYGNKTYTTIIITEWSLQDEPTVEEPPTQTGGEQAKDDDFFNSNNITINDDDLPF